MITEKIKLSKKTAIGYSIPLGPVNLVFIHTDIGLIGCGAIDAAALDKFNYPAAKAKSKDGSPIAKIDDLINGEIKEVNISGKNLGINVGMSAKEALEKL